ncbi:MAG: heavy-metal-associated domain-containing protein [Sedimenticolaceae bacterium]
MNISDIVIHISETLDDIGIHGLQRQIGEESGVYSACMHEKTRHLMVVDFDPMEVQPSQLVHAVRERGLHAVMVGL